VSAELSAMALARTYARGRGLQPLSTTFGMGLTVIAGPNGAGKTTLLRMLATTLHPGSGEVHWCGQSVTRDPIPYRRVLGYLPQAFAVYRSWRAADFLTYMARLKGLSPEVIPSRVAAVLRSTGLEGRQSLAIGTAAHGELRRLGVAQALLAQPRVLILDEPFAGLAPEDRTSLIAMLATYARSNLVLLSSHLLDGLGSHAARLLILHEGRCLVDASPPDLLDDLGGHGAEPAPPHDDRMLEIAYRRVLDQA
jgi:ABC-type multidrug transport system ATPase subunit